MLKKVSLAPKQILLRILILNVFFFKKSTKTHNGNSQNQKTRPPHTAERREERRHIFLNRFIETIIETEGLPPWIGQVQKP